MREETSGQEVNKIDYPALIIKLLNFVDIKAKFNLLLGECDMEVDEKVGLHTYTATNDLFIFKSKVLFICKGFCPEMQEHCC